MSESRITAGGIDVLVCSREVERVGFAQVFKVVRPHSKRDDFRASFCISTETGKKFSNLGIELDIADKVSISYLSDAIKEKGLYLAHFMYNTGSNRFWDIWIDNCQYDASFIGQGDLYKQKSPEELARCMPFVQRGRFPTGSLN